MAKWNWHCPMILLVIWKESLSGTNVALWMSSDAAILLWKVNDSKEVEQAPTFQEDEDAQLNKESWNVVKTLRSSLSLSLSFGCRYSNSVPFDFHVS